MIIFFYFSETPLELKRPFFSHRVMQVSRLGPVRMLQMLSQGDGFSFAADSFFAVGTKFLLSRHMRLHLTFSMPLYISHNDSHSLIFLLTSFSPAGAFFFLVLMQVLMHRYLLSPSRAAHRESHSLNEAELSVPWPTVIVVRGNHITAETAAKKNRYAFIMCLSTASES